MDDLNAPVGSPRWHLDSTDVRKLAKGLGIAVAGSALTWAVAQLAALDPAQYPLLVPVGCLIINLLRKWIEDHT